MTDDFWEDAEVISAYTDEQAVEDGVLIPVKFENITRITKTVFDDFDKGGFDAPGFYKFMAEASKELESQQRIKYDWFYSVLIEGRRYFLVDNGNGFTLMKPEDY